MFSSEVVIYIKRPLCSNENTCSAHSYIRWWSGFSSTCFLPLNQQQHQWLNSWRAWFLGSALPSAGYCAPSFLFTLSPFYSGIMFMAGAKTASPAELKRPQYAPTNHFLSLFNIAGEYMRSPDKKDVMCRACTDTVCRFSCWCDYLQHNEEASEVSQRVAQPLWSSWLILKESGFFFCVCVCHWSQFTAHAAKWNTSSLILLLNATYVMWKNKVGNINLLRLPREEFKTFKIAVGVLCVEGLESNIWYMFVMNPS